MQTYFSHYTHVSQYHYAVMHNLHTQRHSQLLHGRMHLDGFNCLLRGYTRTTFVIGKFGESEYIMVHVLDCRHNVDLRKLFPKTPQMDRQDGFKIYLGGVFVEVAACDISSASTCRESAKRVLPLLQRSTAVSRRIVLPPQSSCNSRPKGDQRPCQYARQGCY